MARRKVLVWVNCRKVNAEGFFDSSISLCFSSEWYNQVMMPAKPRTRRTVSHQWYFSSQIFAVDKDCSPPRTNHRVIITPPIKVSKRLGFVNFRCMDGLIYQQLQVEKQIVRISRRENRFFHVKDSCEILQ